MQLDFPPLNQSTWQQRKELVGVWLQRMFVDLQVDPTIFHSDNKSMLKLAKNPIFHECAKNLDVRCHYIQQLVEKDEIELQYCTTQEQTTNIPTA